MEQNLPIFVFPAGKLAAAVAGENVGTIITA
jgi:hypothetical protein